MPCTRKYPLSFASAPHLVHFDRRRYEGAASQVKQPKQMQEHRAWLASDETGCTGHFLCGARTWFDESGDRWQAFTYRFTDENTAFYFKMRFV